jgi:hypothetical protein
MPIDALIPPLDQFFMNNNHFICFNTVFYRTVISIFYLQKIKYYVESKV